MHTPLLHRVCACSLLALTLAGWTRAASTTWIAPAAGNWDNAASWSNGTPTAGNSAFIDNGAAGVSTVTISSVLRSVGTLGVSAGDFLILSNFAGLQINGNGATSGLANDGRILFAAAGNPTGLLFVQSGTGTISGSGTIIMSGAGGGIVGANTARVVNAGNTIRGIGSICGGSIAFTNNGTIIAEGTGALTIQPNDSAGIGFINNGRLSATTGVLTMSGISGGTFQNNGTISISAGAIARVTANAALTGGHIEGSGSFRVTGAGQLTDVTSSAAIIAEAGAILGATGSFNNAATITVDSAGPVGSEFRLLGDVTLSLGGQVVLTGSFSGIGGAGGVSRLTNSGNTIRGLGYIRNVSVTNNTLISADVNGGTLVISPPSAAGANVINNAMLQATSGGILELGSGAFLNGGSFVNAGTIQAVKGSTVRLLAAHISGGTLHTDTTSTVLVPANTDVRFINVTSLANIEVANNSEILLSGAFGNGRDITLNGIGNPTDLAIAATLEIEGNGTVTLAGPGSGPNGSSAGITGTTGARLTNDTVHTIQGTGNIGRNQIGILNQGTISANFNGGTLTIDPIGTGAGHFLNHGTVTAVNGGRLRLDGTGGGTFSVFGNQLTIDPISALYVTNGAEVLTAPILGGGMLFASGSSNLSTGQVRISRLTIDTGARVRLLLGSGTQGSSVTSVSITDGQLDITNHEFAVLYSDASPIDSIRSQIGAGFNGGAWTGNGIISSLVSTADKTAIGYAEAADVLGPTGGMFGGMNVDGTTVLLRRTYTGDANLDRTVNISDFSRLATNFNAPGTWFNGDFNYDGTVGIGDFSLLASNFNKTLSASVARPGAVPEPAAGALIAMSGLLGRRRRA